MRYRAAPQRNATQRIQCERTLRNHQENNRKTERKINYGKQRVCIRALSPAASLYYLADRIAFLARIGIAQSRETQY